MKQEIAVKIMKLQSFITKYDEDDFDSMDYYDFQEFTSNIAVYLDDIMRIMANIKEE